MVHPGGRPPKFKTRKKLQENIEAYFKERFYDEEGKLREKPLPVTVSGLAYYLGFKDRHSIADYQKKDKFTATIKEAKLRIEQYLEEKLLGNNVAGVIFNLKNNFKWKDTVDPAVIVNNTINADPEKYMKDKGIPIPDIGIEDIEESDE